MPPNPAPAFDPAEPWKCRCNWGGASGTGSKEYVRYHDTEWGVPCYDDQKLFEMLCLEGQQAGLSWSLILSKREHYRRAFKGFAIGKCAKFDNAKVKSLVSPKSPFDIVRLELKVRAVCENAKAALVVQKEFGSLSKFLWELSKQGGPAMSMVLKKRGFKFCGPVTTYSFMQSAGMVNDHVRSCFRYAVLQQRAMKNTAAVKKKATCPMVKKQRAPRGAKDKVRKKILKQR